MPQYDIVDPTTGQRLRVLVDEHIPRSELADKFAGLTVDQVRKLNKRGLAVGAPRRRPSAMEVVARKMAAEQQKIIDSLQSPGHLWTPKPESPWEPEPMRRARHAELLDTWEVCEDWPAPRPAPDLPPLPVSLHYDPDYAVGSCEGIDEWAEDFLAWCGAR